MKLKSGYTAAAAAILAAGAACFSESEYEKKHFETVCYTVTTDLLSKAWDKTKIVFLSDLHDNSFGENNSRLKEAIRSIEPELILIGGDMTTVKSWKTQDFSVLEDLLGWLSERFPVYYANGNHETRMKEKGSVYPGWYRDFLKILKEKKIAYLSNSVRKVEKDGSPLYLYGLNIENRYYAKLPPKSLPEQYLVGRLGPVKKDGFRILLAHSPLFFQDYADWGADLILSGHFHGGTVRIPGIGGIMSPQFHFFSPFNRDFVRKDGVTEIISAGLGTHSINVRLNNPSQLVVLEFAVE